MFFELSDAPAVLTFFREFIRDAPREVRRLPGLPDRPAAAVRAGGPGRRALRGGVSCYDGPAEEGERIVDGLREVAAPVAEHVGPMPYPALNSAFDLLVPPGLQHYWKAAFVTELTDDAIAAHVEHGARVPVVNSTMHIYPINGAVQDVPPDATAFGHRDANFATVIAGMWPDRADNEANTRRVRDYHAAIAPHSQAGGYTNVASADDASKVADNYGANYERLREVKRTWDPGNLFHLNQNIAP